MSRDMPRGRGRGRGRGGDGGDKAAERVRDLLGKLQQAHQDGRLADGPLVDFLNAAGFSARRGGD